MKKIIDISNFTQVNDITALQQFDGCYINATQGGTWVNPRLAELVNLCNRANIPYGLYHFGGHEHTAQQEYDFYKSIVSQYHYSLPLCLDYEDKLEDTNFINQFMALDNTLIFYSYRSLCNKLRYPLNRTWVAIPNFNTSSGLSRYLGIQYKLDCSIDGIENCDLSIFDDSIFNTAKIYENLRGSIEVQNISYGENSNRVKMVQAFLMVTVGYNGGIDGDFGNKTLEAVRAYQKAMGLTVDGIIGVNTIKTMLFDFKNGWCKCTDTFTI